MSTKYMIRNGFSFVEHDGNVKAGGDIIELDDDVAALHLHKLEEAPAPKKVAKVPKPAPAASAATQEEAPAAEGEAAAGEQPAGQPASEEE